MCKALRPLARARCDSQRVMVRDSVDSRSSRAGFVSSRREEILIFHTYLSWDMTFRPMCERSAAISACEIASAWTHAIVMLVLSPAGAAAG